MRPRIARWKGALLSVVLLAGCGGGSGGYKWGLSGDEPLYRSDVRTIAVPIFQSKEFRRGLEFRLTEAIIKRIEADTPWKVVDQSRADTILIGEVQQERQSSFAPDFVTGLPRAKFISISIRFEWKDLRTGKVLVSRDNWIQTISFYPPLQETEYLGQNEDIDKLAERLVEQLQEPW